MFSRAQHRTQLCGNVVFLVCLLNIIIESLTSDATRCTQAHTIDLIDSKRGSENSSVPHEVIVRDILMNLPILFAELHYTYTPRRTVAGKRRRVSHKADARTAHDADFISTKKRTRCLHIRRLLP